MMISEQEVRRTYEQLDELIRDLDDHFSRKLYPESSVVFMGRTLEWKRAEWKQGRGDLRQNVLVGGKRLCLHVDGIPAILASRKRKLCLLDGIQCMREECEEKRCPRK